MRKDIPLDIVGSTKFGRYPKVSVEQTYNMIISDEFLVPYAGYKKVSEQSIIPSAVTGRNVFTSQNYGFMLLVSGSTVYTASNKLSISKVAEIDTSEGDVYIDENNAGQIAICDRQSIYIYNPTDGTFAKAATPGSPHGGLDFIPGYITFQNGRFIAASLDKSEWRLSDVGNGLLWPYDSQHVGAFQTKPDTVMATQRFPGRGNLLYVFGKTVTELWQDVGFQLFPYQRNSSSNIDYGCLNAATIAHNDRIIVWLAANEKSGPVIMYSTGGDPQRISTDGIDFKFSQLKSPANSYGFLFIQDGHLIYQITFPSDMLSYIYDFTTQKFFTVTDENMGAHIAKRLAFFNAHYYFVSFNDGHLYEMSPNHTNYNGKEIPRIRVCNTIRLPDNSRFVANYSTFAIEQGINSTPDIPQKVFLSISRNGGQTFSSSIENTLNAEGKYKNKLIFWRLGSGNELTQQFRFYGLDRFVASNGIVSIYQ